MGGEDTTLTHLLLSEVVNGKDLRTVTHVKAAGKGFTAMEDMSVLAECTVLDLSKNAITSAEPLDGNLSLTYLNLMDNKIDNLTWARRLEQLATLNVGRNEVTDIDGLSKLTKLKALVLNGNKIQSIRGLGNLKNLNTLVLSDNRISVLTGFERLKKLTKVSLGHNELRVLPDMEALPLLQELRLNHNKLHSLPHTLSKNRKLKVLDVGNNYLASMNDLKVVGVLPYLLNINVNGNKVSESEDIVDKIRALVKTVQIVNGKKRERNEYQMAKHNKGLEALEKAERENESRKSKRKRPDSQQPTASGRKSVSDDDGDSKTAPQKQSEVKMAQNQMTGDVEEEPATASGSQPPEAAQRSEGKRTAASRRRQRKKRKISASEQTDSGPTAAASSGGNMIEEEDDGSDSDDSTNNDEDDGFAAAVAKSLEKRKTVPDAAPAVVPEGLAMTGRSGQVKVIVKKKGAKGAGGQLAVGDGDALADQLFGGGDASAWQ